MSSWISNMRGFGRSGNNKPTQPNNPGQPQRTGNGTSPVYGSSLSPSQTNLAPSPTPSSTGTADSSLNQENFNMNRRAPFFFREQYANLIVKGNFMTLAAKPVLIEEGEWLAHQVVEQNRLLDGMLKIIQEADRNTGLPMCNQQTCPAMNAGPGTNYTWAGKDGQPIRIPAPTYINYVQRWIAGKITDSKIFPTDAFTSQLPSLSNSSHSADGTDNWLGKASGFPANFSGDIRNIYRQMMRCYAHIYHGHWLEFWHLGAYKELNTCLIHFVNVGRLFGLLTDKDLEPMGPLIDIWLEKGWLPRPASSGGASVGSAGVSRGNSVAESGSSGRLSPGVPGQTSQQTPAGLGVSPN
ncbi:hypothetical protein MBLNU457_5681t2 [Dothideomycetes sp. NU457]